MVGGGLLHLVCVRFPSHINERDLLSIVNIPTEQMWARNKKLQMQRHSKVTVIEMKDQQYNSKRLESPMKPNSGIMNK